MGFGEYDDARLVGQWAQAALISLDGASRGAEYWSRRRELAWVLAYATVCVNPSEVLRINLMKTVIRRLEERLALGPMPEIMIEHAKLTLELIMIGAYGE